MQKRSLQAVQIIRDVHTLNLAAPNATILCLAKADLELVLAVIGKYQCAPSVAVKCVDDHRLDIGVVVISVGKKTTLHVRSKKTVSTFRPCHQNLLMMLARDCVRSYKCR